MHAVGPAIDGYRPIEDHGLIGNMHTAALVDTAGTISWFCPVAFDHPSMFASVLDHRRGGHWALGPVGDGWTSVQSYEPETAILVTRFTRQAAVIVITDFMPVGITAFVSVTDLIDLRTIHEPAGPHPLVRRVTCTGGSAEIESAIEPRFGYGDTPSVPELLSPPGARFTPGDLRVTVESTREPLTPSETGGLVSRFRLGTGERASFVLFTEERPWGPRYVITEETIDRALEETKGVWGAWCRALSLPTRWREQIRRSAITLKLLTYAPTGAIVAAPTTSLPEEIGGERNWDYRFTWIRDGSFTVQALIGIGSLKEAEGFVSWVQRRFAESDEEKVPYYGPLQLMYTIEGRAVPREVDLFFAGYKGSRPVRTGNGAAEQLQLDIYGELLDAVDAFELEVFRRTGELISDDLWEHLVRATHWVAANWRRPDAGIWEIRGGPWHFTYSRLMCWVAVDRALRIATRHGVGFPEWEAARAAIREDILTHCWDGSRQTFVQHTQTTAVDAALLMMPLVGFIAPTDPAWLSTLDAIGANLVGEDGVRRYNAQETPDGLTGAEGTFTICWFWYVQALVQAGRLDQALVAFEKLLAAATPLGLYSEELGPGHQALGNFPQAFSHLAFTQTALALAKALDSP